LIEQNSRNVHALVVSGTQLNTFGERIHPLARWKIITGIVPATHDLKVTSGSDVRSAVAVELALASRGRVLRGSPYSLVAGHEGRSTTLEIARTIGPRDGLALSVGIALSQAALERSRPLDAICKIASVVVGAADDFVLDVGRKPGNILVAGRLASTGLLRTRSLLDGENHSAHQRAGGQGGGSEDGLQRHYWYRCRRTV
jgi:hypothetical protein